jgi:hypothetical protein
MFDLILKAVSSGPGALHSEDDLLDQFIIWLHYPQQWIGLHKIVREVLDGPVSLFAVLGGLFLLVPALGAAEDLQEKHRKVLVQYLGLSRPMIFEGQLSTGVSLQQKFDREKRGFSIDLRLEELTKDYANFRVHFKDYRGLADKSTTVKVPLKLYRVSPLCEPLEVAPPAYVDSSFTIAFPRLSIALISKWKTEDQSRMAIFAVGQQTD